MTMINVAKALDAEVLVKGENFDKQINHVIASDLMSDVLLVDEENMLLITSLASDQTLRTAQIVGAAGVVVVNGKPLPSSMCQVAEELGMTLLTSAFTKYDACVAVSKTMV